MHFIHVLWFSCAFPVYVHWILTASSCIMINSLLILYHFILLSLFINVKNCCQFQELIPLIICTAMLHPDAKERDNLLNILFNLIKKPDEEQRYHTS